MYKLKRRLLFTLVLPAACVVAQVLILTGRLGGEFAAAVVDKSINIAPNGEITFFGCNSDGFASHLEFILNAGGRGDISVTGATGNVYPINANTAGVDRGWCNTYQNGSFLKNSGRRRSYR